MFLRELKVVYKKTNIPIKKGDSFNQIVEFIQSIIKNEPKEKVFTICLDSQLNIIGYENVSIGTYVEALVSAREVFAPAFLTGATAIILVHNHPSNLTKISDQDYATTTKIKKAGEILNIKLIDHIIVTKNDYKSIIDDMNQKK